MSTIQRYFLGPRGALCHPIYRGTYDRQYAIGRIIQAILVSGVMFGLFCAITTGLGEDPIKLLEDNTVCQITSSAFGGLALAYIIWGARGENELLQVLDNWAQEEVRQKAIDEAGEAAKGLEERIHQEGESDKAREKRIKAAVQRARQAEKDRQKQGGTGFGFGGDRGFGPPITPFSAGASTSHNQEE